MHRREVTLGYFWGRETKLLRSNGCKSLLPFFTDAAASGTVGATRSVVAEGFKLSTGALWARTSPDIRSTPGPCAILTIQQRLTQEGRP